MVYHDDVKWPLRFIRLAQSVATWSKDPKRQVGAIVVTEDYRNFSTGYNGFPRGIADTDERLATETFRQSLMIHAERNALDNARFSLTSCTLYATKFLCVDCAKGVIQQGLTTIVTPFPDFSHIIWGPSFTLALHLLQEVHIRVICYDLHDNRWEDLCDY